MKADKEKAKQDDPYMGYGKKAFNAKSQVAFDVKVYDENEDLDELFDDLCEEFNDVPGLTWNVNYELIDVAYGM